MAKLAVLLLLYLTYHVIYAASPRSSGRASYEAVRSYIDSHGRMGLIRRSTPAEMLGASLRALHEMSKRDLPEEYLLRQQRCKCHCRSRYRNDEWHCCTCTWTEKICFPGHATVRTQNGTTIKMVDLKRGDRVLTVDSTGQVVASEVRAFMQRNTTGIGLYLTLTTSTGQTLTLSKSHLVYTAKATETDMVFRFAEKVEVGDCLLIHQTNTTHRVKVTEKGHVAAEGAYTPLTAHGTLLVDDVMASCYASFHHQVAHVFMSPLRWLPSILEPDAEAEGMRSYVRVLRTLGRWMLPEGIQNEANHFWDFAMASNEYFLNTFLL